MTVDIPNRIAEAMETLSKSRNIDKITVKELTDICGISRQTFYYYFNDLGDVFRLVNERGLKRALKKCTKAASAQEAIEIYILDFLDYYDRIKRGMNGANAAAHVEFVNMSAQRFVTELIKRYSSSALSLKDREFIIGFFASGIAHVIIWQGGKKELDVAHVSERIANLLSCQLGQEQ